VPVASTAIVPSKHAYEQPQEGAGAGVHPKHSCKCLRGSGCIYASRMRIGLERGYSEPVRRVYNRIEDRQKGQT
jgi:hypothetical protein